MNELDAFAFLSAAAVGVGSACFALRRPGQMDAESRDVLICAAHSDDCAIMGAEYAHGSLAAGRSVRIIYLTCSSSSAVDEMARLRQAEAVAAWDSVGIPAANLSCLDLPESSLGGPTAYSEADLAIARGGLAALIGSLPSGSAVIVPALGEDHIDHRTLRRIALEAISQVDRADLVVYETPEYHAHISLVHDPNRALYAILRAIPSMGRLLKAPGGMVRFTEGGRPLAFNDPARLRTKRKLLGMFSSQDNLLGFFGSPSYYRRLAPRRFSAAQGFSFPAFDGKGDWSILLVGVLLLGVIAVGAYAATEALAPPVLRAVLAALAGLAAASYGLRWARRANRETALIVWMAAGGVIASVVG